MGKFLAMKSEHVEIKGVPEEIKILPKGMVHSQKGDFLVDDRAFEMMSRQFKERKVDLVLDYEHQTLTGAQAPAAGWIKDLRMGEDAVVAKVEWTDRAREYLENKEYRYLSPVILVRKGDRRVTTLQHAALTNTPAIDGMFPIVNSLNIDDATDKVEKEDKIMDLTLKEILEMLGLPEDAAKAEVENTVAKMKAAAEKLREAEAQPETVANSVVLGVLGLDESAKTEDVVVKIMSLGNGNAEVAQLREDMKKKEARDAVQLALTAGKITAAQKDWALQYALADKEGFDRFVQMAPGAVNMQQVAEHQETAEQTAAGSKMEVDPVILKNCGLTREDVEQYANKEG